MVLSDNDNVIVYKDKTDIAQNIFLAETAREYVIEQVSPEEAFYATGTIPSTVGVLLGEGAFHAVSSFVMFPQSLSSARELQIKIKNKWPDLVEKARILRNQHPDPIRDISELLGNLPGDDEIWRHIYQEPYG